MATNEAEQSGFREGLGLMVISKEQLRDIVAEVISDIKAASGKNSNEVADEETPDTGKRLGKETREGLEPSMEVELETETESEMEEVRRKRRGKMIYESGEERRVRMQGSLQKREAELQRELEEVRQKKRDIGPKADRYTRSSWGFQDALEQNVQTGRGDVLAEIDAAMRNRSDGTLGPNALRFDPFTDNLVEEEPEKGFRAPEGLPTYDGKGDPISHITDFDMRMATVRHSEGMKCKLFACSLQRGAKTWFKQLEPCSVGSYQELVLLFTTRYAVNIEVPPSKADLYAVRYDPKKESLRKFVDRFNNVAQDMQIDLKERVELMKRALGISKLGQSLSKSPPKTLGELLRKIIKYIRVDDDIRAGEKQGTDIPVVRIREVKPERFVRRDRRKEVYAAEAEPLAYCRIHETVGHDTADCRLMREMVEQYRRERGVSTRGGFDNTNPGQKRTWNKRNQAPVNRPPWARGRPLEKTQEPNMPKGENVRRNKPEELGNTSHVRNSPPHNREIFVVSGGTDFDSTSKSRKRYLGEARKGGIYRIDETSKEPEWKRMDVGFNLTDIPKGPETRNEPIVLAGICGSTKVRRILVDQGSSCNIMKKDVAEQLENTKDGVMNRAKTELYAFDQRPVPVVGKISMPVTFGASGRYRTERLEFMILDTDISYNIILGRPGINEFGMIPSTVHLKVKFPTPGGVCTMTVDQPTARSCYISSCRNPLIKKPRVMMVEDQQPKELPRQAMEPVGFKNIQLAADVAQVTRIGLNLSADMEYKLTDLLRRNIDIFAWTPADFVGIDRNVAEHHINTHPNARPVRQKQRHFSEEKCRIIKEKTMELLEARYVREVRYSEWAANPVIVPKPGGKWRMCVDFTDLNACCERDPYPLPKIDRLVDAVAGSKMLSTMDAYSGYHQIFTVKADQTKTTFYTKDGVYCYVVMPFGLKNAGATYQRLVNKIFEKEIGRSMEVYVDDMIVKSMNDEDHLGYLDSCFALCRSYGLKLNPLKCCFGVTSGKFLGHYVSERGIEADPEKIKAIREMQPPKSVRGYQSLTGKLAALSRFISRSADRSASFFKVLRKGNMLEWNEDCRAAFEKLKEYLSSPPLLVAPKDGEPLGLYLAVSPVAVSGVLVTISDEKHRPVYYVSKVLLPAEGRYTNTEKFVLALKMSATKLRPYFQDRLIKVFTNQPLRNILSRPDVAGRVAKWAVELSTMNIEFVSRTAIKAQPLADFLVEMTRPVDRFVEHNDRWSMSVDGSTYGGAGGGIDIKTSEGDHIYVTVKFRFPATNNVAEYEALIEGMRLARELGVVELDVNTDSRLVQGQYTGDFETHDPLMALYRTKVKDLAKGFKEFTLSHVPREQNVAADSLARFAAGFKELREGNVIIRLKDQPSITIQAVNHISEAPNVDTVPQFITPAGWMEPYIKYLKKGEKPIDKVEARKLEFRARRYVLVDGMLYKKSFNGPLMKCINNSQAQDLLTELHEGECGNHTGSRVLCQKVLRAGYYWPSLGKDATEMVKKCKVCQYHSSMPRKPVTDLVTIPLSCPFDKWGVDIMGPFPQTTGQKKFIIVAVEYFSKWIEAEAVAKISEGSVVRFLWRNVLIRFGIPRELITDNGTQFAGAKMDEFTARYAIKHNFSSVYHPQSNGQTEVSNRTLRYGIKTKLEDVGGSWADRLEEVLWAYRTTPRTTTGETPFSLVYGSEAVCPIELTLKSFRVEHYEEDKNSEVRKMELDLAEEKRQNVYARISAYQKRVEKQYNKSVKPRSFLEGDLVLRSIPAQRHVGKLERNWEGPYRVTQVIGQGAYKLERLDGIEVPRSWNGTHLRRYYV